jgi:uncharacterized membrane protein YjfL (UPF0719 family)
MVLLKGIGVASRTVTVFCILWVIIVYVFAVVFRQLTEDHSYKHLTHNFRSVPESMNTLLLDGILPMHSSLVNDVGAANWTFWPIMISFIVIVSLILFNMLIGVMVDVTQVISEQQKEGLTATIVATNLREIMADLNKNPDAPFTKFEFQKFVIEPEVMSVLFEHGVDIIALLEGSEIIFEDMEKQGEVFDFPKLIDIVLDMRGTNPATVKDVNETLRVIKSFVQDLEHALTKNLSTQFNNLRAELCARDADRDVRRKRKSSDESDSDSDEVDGNQMQPDQTHGTSDFKSTVCLSVSSSAYSAGDHTVTSLPLSRPDLWT